VNNILRLRSARVEDLGAPANLEWVFLLHHLLVHREVPLGGKSKTRVAFLDTTHIGDFLVKFFNLIFALLQRIRIRALAIPSEQLDILLGQWSSHLVLRFLVLALVFSLRLLGVLFCHLKQTNNYTFL